MELNNNNHSKAYLFVQSIFILDQNISNENNEDDAKEIIKYMKQNSYNENVPYPAIAQYVYENEDIDPSFEETVDNHFEEKYPKFAEKFKRHVNLSLTQKEYIQQEINNKIQESQEEVEDLSKQYEDLKEKAQKMSSEYISILGIFSALIFGLFGGFNTLTSSFSTFVESNTYGQAIFYISILGLSLVTLIYFLLYWIGIVINKPIHNTDSRYSSSAIANALNTFNDLVYGSEKKEIPFTRKHKTYLVIATSFLIMALIGVALNIIENYYFVEDYAGFLLIVILGSIVGLAIFIGWLLKKR